jgi:preprotein translocase subunit SecD
MSSGSKKRCLLSPVLFWILIAIGGLYYIFPNVLDRTTTQRFKMSRLKLGIDLKGGTYITLGVDVDQAVENRLASQSKFIETLVKRKKIEIFPTKKEIKKGILTLVFADEEAAKVYYNLIRDEIPTFKTSLNNNNLVVKLASSEVNIIQNDSVEQAEQIISDRLNGLGVENIIVQRHGAKQIVVQIPGIDDPRRVKELITRRAHLEFKLVEKSSSSKDELLDIYDGELPPDKMIVPELNTKNIEDEESGTTWFLVSAFPDLTGDHIADARVTYGDYGQPVVSFKLDRSGAKVFKELTGSNINRQIAIIIDGKVQSAPVISTAIGAEGIIKGNFTFKTAKDLAIVLKAGAFQAPVVYQEERRIGPSMGQDSIRGGLLSCLVGIGLVFIFSLFYYKLGGLFAMFALFYNLFLILLFLSYFGATLTLPGIAGMVLTIGMAIDASILIYERVKEELAEGVSFRKAINQGFSGAMVVILDSNITTFLTGLVLFYFGGPNIRGFAITLMVGIVATVLAGVYFLKSIFNFILDCTPFKKVKI